jgi:hypothetical protein
MVFRVVYLYFYVDLWYYSYVRVHSVAAGSVTAGMFRKSPCSLLCVFPACICYTQEEDLWNLILVIVFRSLWIILHVGVWMLICSTVGFSVYLQWSRYLVCMGSMCCGCFYVGWTFWSIKYTVMWLWWFWLCALFILSQVCEQKE